MFSAAEDYWWDPCSWINVSWSRAIDGDELLGHWGPGGPWQTYQLLFLIRWKGFEKRSAKFWLGVWRKLKDKGENGETEGYQVSGDGDLEEGEKQLHSGCTLKVELMALLIAQMWGKKGNPLECSSHSLLKLFYVEGWSWYHQGYR